ncbi:MAG TPA: hypothetical protein VFD90_06370 [Gaiellales bacterium]|jgi:hypothetical protein|nr:hypothetical protein [Gaiellales bacterium]
MRHDGAHAVQESVKSERGFRTQLPARRRYPAGGDLAIDTG